MHPASFSVSALAADEDRAPDNLLPKLGGRTGTRKRHQVGAGIQAAALGGGVSYNSREYSWHALLRGKAPLHTLGRRRSDDGLHNTVVTRRALARRNSYLLRPIIFA